MENKIEIFKTNTGTEINVKLENETIWLDAHTIADLFGVNRPAIVKHIGNVYKSKELDKSTTCSILEHLAKDKRKRMMNFYNLDMILSVGYRVNSSQATKFRQWATQRLKDYLVKGYAINQKRLTEKQQEIEYLKTGIRIVSRAIENATDSHNQEVFQLFSRGLALLDDYDHEELDRKGLTIKPTQYPNYNDYLRLIDNMYSEFQSDIFAQPKDESFKSSIGQIMQKFDGKDLYPSIEEKAANLLYYIVKNHSFVDGNKRIGAACFIYFLEQNNALLTDNKTPIIDNHTLASLTLFIATSQTEEADIVKQLVISILNRNV